MPEPLHIPATVTCLPSNSNVHATSLLLVSVVIIASAASLASSLLLPSTLERAVTPCAAAGVFTTNLVKAAPVKWDKEIVTTSPYVQAVVVNSGIANACTGAEGLGYCADTAAEAAAALNIPKTAVLVASTGVIGKQLPIDKIKSGVTALSKVLGSSREDAKLAAEAIPLFTTTACT